MAKECDAVLQQADAGLKPALDRLMQFLRFPSMGTDPAHKADCVACAQWLARDLASMGFATEILPTSGQPAVVGRLGEDAALPHILFYGHYDVQPPDPLDLWTSPPFSPEIRNNTLGAPALYARGAHDDKGQVMTFLEACRAWLAQEGPLPFRLTVLIEGDEEGDNSHLDRFLAEHGADFRADIALVCDTELWGLDTPAIVTRLRGTLAEEIVVEGPRIDLHSGYFGGPARNPIHVLGDILGHLHDDEGRVQIPGFYDEILPVSDAERKSWKRLKFDGKAFLKDVGLSVPAGEKDQSVLDQTWARPTAEINGVTGGYQGPGAKTVLPAMASAKLTFRLVPGQKPQKIRAAFRKFVRAHLPADCRVRFLESGSGTPASVVNSDSAWISLAARAAESEWGKPAVLIGAGGSIPVVNTFRKLLQMDTILMGFSRPDDAAHSPDEKYDVECFQRGIRTWIRLFGLIREEQPHA